MNAEEAERIAIAALGHVAADETLMTRFLSVTGIDPGEIRAAAADPAFLAGVPELAGATLDGRTLTLTLAYRPEPDEAGTAPPAGVEPPPAGGGD